MTVKLADIPWAFHLPRPNWDAIRSWIGENVPAEERYSAWTDVAHQWLDAMNAALGNAYQTLSYEEFILFAPRDFDQSEFVLRFVESIYVEVREQLGSIAGEGWSGPLVIFAFGDDATYYEYLSAFYSEGNHGGSGGFCIKEGYVHIAVNSLNPEYLQPAVTHEMAHACLCHLDLPLWLEEGFTQWVEELARSQWSRFALDAESAREVRQYWHEHGLQDFWWGKGFFLPDDGQKASYRLAEILFRFLLSDHRQQFSAFVHQANAADAGESAARDSLGMGLANLAAKFLGDGPWSPVPQNALTFASRARLHVSRGANEPALEDLNEALRLDPRVASAWMLRGGVFQELGRYESALTDFREALRLEPQQADALNALAWLLATCPDDAIRNGEESIQHAKQACELTGYANAAALDTLAAALAEVGDFAEAVECQTTALEFSPDEMRERCSARLQLYQGGQPFRERSGVTSMSRHS